MATEQKTTSYSCFAVTIEDGVAQIRMTRADQRNSMNVGFWNELPRIIEELESNDAVRAAVLSADGPVFSSGMDLSVFANPKNLATDTAKQRERLRRLVLKLQDVITRVEKCRFPIIAAIGGPCIGGGFDLVTACDLRYASAGATFNIHEINLGMMADLGTLQRLPRLIPEGVVRELALTGDKLTAQRAYELGLVSAVVEPDKLVAHATEVAKKIAARSPLAVLASRQAIAYARSHSIEDSLDMAATLQAGIFNPADVTASVTAQKGGTAATFANLDNSEIKL